MKNLFVLASVLLACISVSAQEEDEKWNVGIFCAPVFEKRFYPHHTDQQQSTPDGYTELAAGAMGGLTFSKESVVFAIGYFKFWNTQGPYFFSGDAKSNEFQGVHLSLRFPMSIAAMQNLRIGCMYNGGKFGHAPVRHLYAPGDYLGDEIGLVISWQFPKEFSFGKNKLVFYSEPMLAPAYATTDGFLLHCSMHFWIRYEGNQ